MRTLSLVLAILLLPCAQAAGQTFSQTLPAGFDTIPGGSATSFPFNTTADHTWQWHYSNANFAGITGPITITEVSVRALSATATVNAFDFPNLEVVIGSAITGYQLAQHDPVFANNLCSDQVIFRTGPLVGGPVVPAPGATAAPWIPLSGGLPINPFTFDPTSGRDLIIQIRKCGTNATFGTSLDGRTGTTGAVLGNRYGSTTSCTATTQSFNNNEYVPVVNIEYVIGGTPGICLAPYQTNNAGASLTWNGTADPGASSPLVVSLPTLVPASLDLNSSAAGFPWDIAFTIPTNSVPLGMGGISTPFGQVFNVSIVDPSFGLLFGGFLSPPFIGGSFPVTVPSSLDLTGQLIVVNPINPDGFSLSRAADAQFRSCSVTEDFESLALGQGAPLAWTNGAAGGARWTVDANGTTSAGTGPTSAFQGLNYLYCETSGFTTTTFRIDTCAVSISTLATFNLDFALSRIGATTGTLTVLLDDGSGTFATTIATYTGPDATQAQGAIEWSNESISIIPFLPASGLVAFRFEYLSGTSFTGDLAIDDIRLL